MTQSLPTFNQLTESLDDAQLTMNPAEIHGLLCGFIAATGQVENTIWEKCIAGAKAHTVCRELLLQLYETSYELMSEFSFDFTLLLPDDEVDLNTRAESLALWCQGFLTALKQAKIPLTNRPASEATETLNDFMEIAQVTYGDLTADEEDEAAYFELVEYVRLGVLLIFQDLHPDEDKPFGETTQQKGPKALH